MLHKLNELAAFLLAALEGEADGVARIPVMGLSVHVYWIDGKAASGTPLERVLNLVRTSPRDDYVIRVPADQLRSAVADLRAFIARAEGRR